MATHKEKSEIFKALHEREGAFIIPNPWDIGSARLLAGLGFEALAQPFQVSFHLLTDLRVLRDRSLLKIGIRPRKEYILHSALMFSQGHLYAAHTNFSGARPSTYITSCAMNEICR